MMIHDIVLKPMSHPPFLQDYRIRERLVMLCSQDVDGCFCMTACMVPKVYTCLSSASRQQSIQCAFRPSGLMVSDCLQMGLPKAV